jgi:transposase
MDPQEEALIKEEAERLSIRALARKFGRDRKKIRQLLGRKAQEPKTEPKKLARFEKDILEMAEKGLTVSRILRDLRSKGYQGSRTILADFLREKRGPKKPARRVVRRFETPAALEAQVDWSPFRVLLGGKTMLLHCFAMVLAYSRMLYVAFYRNEKLETLLGAHVEAFSYFGGLAHRYIYDNMATVTLGRSGAKPIWNPRFLEFARHCGFTPWVCRPRDPDRKGKIEKVFPFVESDLLRSSAFESLDDLNRRALKWLNEVANLRLHSTTRRRPADMFAEEKPLLIELPTRPFPTGRQLVRKVQADGYVSVDGSFYPVPAELVGQYVTILVYSSRLEILGPRGELRAEHKVPDQPTRLGRDWGPPPPSSEAPLSRSALETRFLRSFPEAAEFLEGLRQRMKALTPIHLRQIERLLALYGEERVEGAIQRALRYRNYSALALRRILERAYPQVISEPEIEPLGGAGLGALDGIETGSPEDYTLDTEPPTKGGSHGEEN